MIPQFPVGKHFLDRPLRADPIDESIEERIEVVIEDDERLPVGMIDVVALELPHHLQLERGLPRPLLAEHDRRARVVGVAVDLVPGRMEGRLQAGALEDGVVLRVFLRKRIAGDAMVVEEVLDLHVGR